MEKVPELQDGEILALIHTCTILMFLMRLTSQYRLTLTVDAVMRTEQVWTKVRCVQVWTSQIQEHVT